MVSWVFGFVDARSRRLFLFHTFNSFVSSVSGLQSRVCSVSWAFILVGPSVSRTSRLLSLPCPILFFLRTLSTKSVKPGRKIRHHFLHPKDLDSKFPVGHRLRCYCHKRFLHLTLLQMLQSAVVGILTPFGYSPDNRFYRAPWVAFTFTTNLYYVMLCTLHQSNIRENHHHEFLIWDTTESITSPTPHILGGTPGFAVARSEIRKHSNTVVIPW